MSRVCPHCGKYIKRANRPIIKLKGDIATAMNPNNSYTVTVDRADAELLKDCLWSPNAQGHAVRGHGGRIRLAALITGAQKGDAVFHVNGNPSDCRRANLMVRKRGSTLPNAKPYRTNTTGFKGVYYSAARQRYLAKIWVNKEFVYLGSFFFPSEAARAYNKAARQFFGNLAYQNEI